MNIWYVVILLAIVSIFLFPTWGHSRSWGYAPFGGLGGLILLLIILKIFGFI